MTYLPYTPRTFREIVHADLLRLGEIEGLTRAEIGDECLASFPRGEATLDARAIAELEEWFGPTGKCPAEELGRA